MQCGKGGSSGYTGSAWSHQPVQNPSPLRSLVLYKYRYAFTPGQLARLTLIGQNAGEFEEDVLLSRSRFLAPAAQTLRFYREYFKPVSEKVVEKDRLRWHVKFKGEEFFINLDSFETPKLGTFLEIKSRTWSRKDAKIKAALALELVNLLGAGAGEHLTRDYVTLAG